MPFHNYILARDASEFQHASYILEETIIETWLKVQDFTPEPKNADWDTLCIDMLEHLEREE
jgi:hypothetical protein